MDDRPVLLLGATGMLGLPVAQALASRGHRVRSLARNAEAARRLLGDGVDVVEGSAVSLPDVQSAMAGCEAVHINLPQEAELTAAQHVVRSAADQGIDRISYVSATTVCEANRWFELVDVKMRTEELLAESGIPHVVFCPTWVMESLENFIHGTRGVVIIGRNPPPLHFFAATDFGRMVAESYADRRAIGKRLFVHGPEGIRLPDAVERLFAACHPELKVMRLRLWQAGLMARFTRREELKNVTNLIDYFDRVGEIGDPSEANALLGAPSITLDEWFALPHTVARHVH
jgi:uncharacterized protein YbjT (DUF2867 family)